MKKLISFSKTKEWILFICFILFVVAQVILSLRIPDHMSEITTLIQRGNVEVSVLALPGAKMFLCALSAVICSVAAGFCISKMTATLITRIRNALFEKIMSFSLPEMAAFSSSSLITRCTNDVMQLQNFCFVGLFVMVQGPVTAVLAIIKMKANSTWLIISAVIVVLMILLFVVIILIVQKKSVLNQQLIDKINRITREHLSGLRVVHAYNGYDLQGRQFDSANDELTKTGAFVNKTTGMISPVLTLFMNLLSLLIYISGVYMIMQSGGYDEKIAVFSEMIVFSSYALQAMAGFILMLMAIIMLPRVMVSSKRITEVLDMKNSITDGDHPAETEEEKGVIEFRDVSFAYAPGSGNALSHISFRIEKGMTVAITGATGSGKTTLLNLIPRLYDVTDGAVLVDGRDVREYKLSELREKIGYVPQKSFLFSGTIAYNIDYGQKNGFQAALSDIKKAAEIGQSKDFIERKEKNYSAWVEEGGANFSGGQRQRLTISRAVCRNPEYYIFDDSFSALDFKTDSTLRRNLRDHAKDATQIIVGQRVGSIKNADMILVLNKGELVGKGTHDELLSNCPVYREIVLSQLSSGEAAT